jgi:hypothetical protein
LLLLLVPPLLLVLLLLRLLVLLMLLLMLLRLLLMLLPMLLLLLLLILGCCMMQAGHEAQVELQMSDDSTQVQFDFHKCASGVLADSWRVLAESWWVLAESWRVLADSWRVPTGCADVHACVAASSCIPASYASLNSTTRCACYVTTHFYQIM